MDWTTIDMLCLRIAELLQERQQLAAEVQRLQALADAVPEADRPEVTQ